MQRSAGRRAHNHRTTHIDMSPSPQTPTETPAAPLHRSLQLMPLMDADKTGTITMGEFERGLRSADIDLGVGSERYRQLFRQIDVDRSKAITKDELVAMLYKGGWQTVGE